MSILIGADTRLIVQGITGRDGSFHTRSMIDDGTQVVAGVTPGKGGETVLDLPVFDTVEEAVEKTGANATMIFVPAPCITGWKFNDAETMKLATLGAQCGAFP